MEILNAIFCLECKNSKFDEYGQNEWICLLTEKLNPIYRNKKNYKSCWKLNKNNNCSFFSKRESIYNEFLKTFTELATRHSGLPKEYIDKLTNKG